MSNKPIAMQTIDNKFPEKPITLIVPFSAGGGTDLIARAMEKVSVKNLGQTLMVVNKPGGAGAIGWNELAGSSPNGYTLGIITPELISLSLYSENKYHYLTSLEPIVQVAGSSFVMIVQADAPWKNIHELIEYAKQHPRELKFSHAGIGSMPHIVGESFAKITDINIEQVPFRGASEAIIALLGNHVQITFMSSGSAKEQIKSGKVRALAVSSEQRLTDPSLAHIPTFKEQRLDVIFNNWYGVATPKGLSPEVKTELAEGLKSIVFDPEFKNSMDALGLEIQYLGPQETQEIWIADNEKLTKIIQETGILDIIKAQKN